CLSERAIFDTVGDTRFIDLTGIRSFNAIQQLQNEGRNSPFSAPIQSIFGPDIATIVQDTLNSAAIEFNNYELYSVNSTLGNLIAKYDTINGCWVSFDYEQLNGKRAKQFAALNTGILALFAITEDDEVYELYASETETDTGRFRTIGVTANLLYANYNIKMNNPKSQVKLLNTRFIVNKVVSNSSVTVNRFVDNRLFKEDPDLKTVIYTPPAFEETDPYALPDVNTQLANVTFPSPNIQQGWKVFADVSWTGGTITQFSMELSNQTPQNPVTSQGVIE
ncbi:MAG TPA: hypothetical protein VNZ45_07940, partial [Bacteroidia bacterium]|nr:hypothetical protein [Bacteroidia bacterium]